MQIEFLYESEELLRVSLAMTVANSYLPNNSSMTTINDLLAASASPVGALPNEERRNPERLLTLCERFVSSKDLTLSHNDV